MPRLHLHNTGNSRKMTYRNFAMWKRTHGETLDNSNARFTDRITAADWVTRDSQLR